MSYSTSVKNNYTEPNKPYWIIWCFVVILSLIAVSVMAQPCNFQTVFQANDGDTICCDEVQATWAANNPSPVPGEINTFFLDATRPDLGQAFVTAVGALEGQIVKYQWLRPDGLYQPVFSISECPPEPPPVPSGPQSNNNQISNPLWDIPFTADYGRWIELNHVGTPIPIRVEWCRNQICRGVGRFILSNDTRVPIVYKWQEIRVYSRDGLIAILQIN